MKKNKFWFTLIEIIVAISILTITSVFVISSFNKNLNKQSLQEELSIFSDFLDDFENNLWKDITDYEINIFTWAFYSYTSNKLSKTKFQKIQNINWFTWIINKWISWATSKIYFNNELVFTHTWAIIYPYNFSKKWNYNIETTYLNDAINSLYLEHFSKIDLNKNILLTQIKDDLNNDIEWLIIKNSIWQKRQFFNQYWTDINSDINLYFEDELNQIILKLKK